MASASDIGTGDDLTIAAEISDNGSARRFREDGVVTVEPTGAENNLEKRVNEQPTWKRPYWEPLHPYTFRNSTKSAQQAFSSRLFLTQL
jgi:hypothetical protein